MEVESMSALDSHDPIMAAIAEHRAAVQVFDAALLAARREGEARIASGGLDDGPVRKESNEACMLEYEIRGTLVSTKPTTLAGVKALVEYLAGAYGEPSPGNVIDQFMEPDDWALLVQSLRSGLRDMRIGA
jgi:hypothetical protein